MDFSKIRFLFFVAFLSLIGTGLTQLPPCSNCEAHQYNKGLTTYCTPLECDEAGTVRVRCTASSTVLSILAYGYNLHGWGVTCPAGKVCCPTIYQEFCPSVTIPESGITVGKACKKYSEKTIDCWVCRQPTCPVGATSADAYCANSTAIQDNCAAGLVCCANTLQFACQSPDCDTEL